MNLYLLRHAIAAERDRSTSTEDHERPLTPKGERRMHTIAQGILKLGVTFDLILSSPYRRAEHTADIVAAAFKAQEILHISTILAPEGNPRHLIAELRGTYKTYQHILLVGHEPYLSGLVALLVSGEQGLRVVMKKGGLCKLRTHGLRYGRCAILEWLLTPRQLRLLA
jgi:phosphohistidine phosphatase